MTDFSKFIPDSNLDELLEKPFQDPIGRLYMRSQYRLFQIIQASDTAVPVDHISNLHWTLSMFPNPSFFGD